MMSTDRIAFALWNTSINQSELLVVRRYGRFVELALRGGSAHIRSIVLRKRD